MRGKGKCSLNIDPLPLTLVVARKSRADGVEPHPTPLDYECHRCHSILGRIRRSPKRRSASPTPPSPKAPFAFGSPTNSGRSSVTTNSPICSPLAASLRIRLRGLALASVLQYVEGLSDRQAADAVRGRIDWKYALGLELTDPGFDHTVLSEFRSRLVNGQAEQRLLDTSAGTMPGTRPDPSAGPAAHGLDSCLAAVRVLNRLERVGETMRAALNELAVMAPDWLQALAPAEWYRRYGSRVENYHLPKTEAARERIGPGDRGRR